MGLVFNPFTGTFDFTGSGGSGSGDVTHTGTLTAHEVILGNGGADIKALGSVGALGEVLTSGGAGVDPSWQPAGSGTIGGTIASPQVAFGTGVNTIGGSNDFEWDGTTVVFSSAHGLSFAGASAPITIVGGDDGAGDTALVVDNADNYWVLNSQTPFQLQVTATGSSIYFDPTFLDLVPEASITASVQLVLNNVAGHGTDKQQLAVNLFAHPDGVTGYLNPTIFFGDADSQNPAYSLFMEGVVAAGVYSEYRFSLFDQVNTQTIFFIDHDNPTTFIFDTGISVVAENITVINAVGTAAVIPVDQVGGSTLVFNAYDVDGAAYKTFATLTNGNTPSFALAFPAGGTLTGNFSTLQVNSVTVATTADVADVETLAWLM